MQLLQCCLQWQDLCWHLCIILELQDGFCGTIESHQVLPGPAGCGWQSWKDCIAPNMLCPLAAGGQAVFRGLNGWLQA